jgi:proteasome lid subunit RPN8/RPN11
MTVFTPEIIQAVAAHAAQESPKEACGLVIVFKGRKSYIPCTNATEVGGDRFLIPAEEYAAAEDKGEIIGICHSHPFISPEPSQADRCSCEITKLPWLIVNHPIGSYSIIEPSGYKAPLVGREFSHGVLDCYQLCKDYYEVEHGIQIPHYDRAELWWEKGMNLIVDNFKEAGFSQIEESELKPGDAILLQLGATVPNHAAIYVGDNLILHHVTNRLSSRDVYGGYWRKAATTFLRHKSLA